MWAESWKTRSASSILPFSGTGGITQKVNMLGMQDRAATPAFTVHTWMAQYPPTPPGWGHAALPSPPQGQGGVTAPGPEVGRPEQEVQLRTFQNSFL